ncbi:MAG: type II secretion system protein [Phycisphaerales bacterium]|nr:MAG: type II secretion system protein [Phycisphaerales bacterium]
MRRIAMPSGCAPCARDEVSRRRASTVLELLIVVLIIGIALGMLLPSLKRSVELARSAVCMHNLREVGHCLTLYRVENDGWMPSDPQQETGLASSKNTSSSVWFVKLHPTYLADVSALTCPSDPYRYRLLRVRDALDSPAVADYASYGINSLLIHGAGGNLANLDRHMPTRPLDTILVADLGPDGGPIVSAETASQKSAPARSLTGFSDQVEVDGVDHDGVGEDGKGQVATYKLRGPKRNGGLLSWDDGYDPLEPDVSEPWLTVRHGEGIQILTLAGGVRGARTRDVLRRPVHRYYHDCASGGCSLCTAPRMRGAYHYSFARDRLYWWTGPVRAE